MCSGGFVRQPQIFLIELRAKSRFVVALQHPLAVHFEDAARGDSAEERLPHACAVDSCLAGERHRLADAGQRAADRDLIADLAQLTRAWLAADVDDPLWISHALEDRPHTGKRGGITADHDRERRVDRADLAAADWRIEHRAA